ncbi:Ferm domain-containing protein 4a [Plakobranchus ocellatus]|uniref:Ferm domain-containing protein 4a n=1 Tax=Plakobranchus ocellatus TaxID=259542 RepID=A0AAV4DL84_9GAST|nr:Ferm domain-containing protein 4a [Plakobranchus ocellatus]
MNRKGSGPRLRRRLSLRQCLQECCQMSEGRKSQVILLDERRLDIIIQPKLYSSDLLDLVASHFKLREKQYFGLGFYDETYHFNWLQGEKRVLDHEFPKKTGLLVLHFAIRFYVETIGLLRDTQTVELFYLNARQGVFRVMLILDPHPSLPPSLRESTGDRATAAFAPPLSQQADTGRQAGRQRPLGGRQDTEIG